MDKEKRIEILDEWNLWSRTPDCGILREWYLQDTTNNLISLEVVIQKLNEQSPKFLNKLIRRAKTNQTVDVNYKFINYKKRLLEPGFGHNFTQKKIEI